MNELSLFTGIGGGILASQLLGWRIVCGVEIDPYCREVLFRRQEEGILEPFPIWSNARTFDGTAWRGVVDIVTAGFPCQPFSVAGKRRGADDPRNMWPDTIRIIGEVGPRYALLENVPGLITSGYFDTILSDITALGYDCRWGVIGADDVGAPHRRKRLWMFLDDPLLRGHGRSEHEVQAGRDSAIDASQVADPERARLEGPESARSPFTGGLPAECRCEWWDIDPADLPDRRSALPGLGRMVAGNSDWLDLITAAFDGQIPRVARNVPYRVDRLKGLGNAQVPACVREAWRRLR